jgi:hypothetical protein
MAINEFKRQLRKQDTTGMYLEKPQNMNFFNAWY